MEWCGQVIVRVHQKQVRGWLEPPLKSGIEVDVFDLLVVLDKGGEKDGIGHRHIHSRAYQPKLCLAPRLWKVDLIEIGA